MVLFKRVNLWRCFAMAYHFFVLPLNDFMVSHVNLFIIAQRTKNKLFMKLKIEKKLRVKTHTIYVVGKIIIGRWKSISH